MARLIDAEALKAKYAWWANGGSDAKEWKEAFDFMVDNARTVESELKHGHWVFRNVEDWGASNCRCSVCGAETYIIPTRPDAYCSQCGSKMDEVEE